MDYDDFFDEEDERAQKRQFRLPREDNFVSVPFDVKPNLMDTAKAILGPRMTETRLGYRLDGKPCNVRDLLRAANLKYADE